MKQFRHYRTGLIVRLVKYSGTSVYLLNTKTQSCFKMGFYDFNQAFAKVS